MFEFEGYTSGKVIASLNHRGSAARSPKELSKLDINPSLAVAVSLPAVTAKPKTAKPSNKTAALKATIAAAVFHRDGAPVRFTVSKGISIDGKLIRVSVRG
ncbi:MAG TPA: hypothetical protein DCE44_07625 [Verrucomicrobiales bacterium]|nr:hypothetical protein [Verrucomicrobiales bacterium]